ncbi:unnamed protein product [Cercospora beticola]|nr:unnamed protein product [Cercospora beticola]
MQFNEPDWIAADPSNHIVFDWLVTFLEEASAAPAKLKALAASTTLKLTSAGTPNPTVNRYRSECRYLFGILLTIVQQLDATAPEQNYFVSLVLALREVPAPQSVTDTIYEGDLDREDFTRRLHAFIHVWSGMSHDAPLHPRLQDRCNRYDNEKARPPWRQEKGKYLCAARWTSLSAFMAKVHVATPDVYTLDCRGLFAMIEALEQPLTPAELEDALPPAAYWILYAGKELKENDFPYAYYPEFSGSKQLPWSKGVLWNGQHAFNPARWGFWLQRFKAIAERPENNEEVRDLARRAFDFGSSLE